MKFQYTEERPSWGLLPYAKVEGNEVNRILVDRSQVKIRNPLHQHDYFQLWYMQKGSCIHHVNGTDFMQSTGDMIIIPPFLDHYLDTSKSNEVNLIRVAFSDDFIDSAIDQAYQESLYHLIYFEPLIHYPKQIRPILQFAGESAMHIEQILEDLLDEYERRDTFFSTIVRSDMARLLTLIAREYEGYLTGEKNQIFADYRVSIQDALNYIDTHFTKKIYLKDAAQKAMMSPRSFSYIFKTITGKTFVEYLNYVRTLHAAELLIHTDKTLLEIGLDCGFRDAVNFSRVFKKITGYQPSAYRSLDKLE